MAETSIQWTDKVWNPIRGCSRVSPGCQHCYAEKTAYRFSQPGMPYEGLVKLVGGEPRWTGKIQLVPEKLEEPLHWQKPCRVFVNSMSDLFHEDVPDEYIDRVFAVMALAGQHTFQVLTKRAERMAKYLSDSGTEERIDEAACDLRDTTGLNLSSEDWVRLGRGGFVDMPLDNVWLGVSVEDQQRADERIPHLLRTPAVVRFLSCEPLLSAVDLQDYLLVPEIDVMEYGSGPILGYDRLLHWLICGGESGPNARPFDLAWAYSLLDQCRKAGVPYFLKQLGSKPFSSQDRITHRGRKEPLPANGFWRYLNDSKGGDMAEFPKALRVREYPG